MRKDLLIIYSLISIILLVLWLTPFGWKIQGKTFINSTMNGTEIIYKGKVVATYPSDCAVSFNAETGEHKAVCK